MRLTALLVLLAVANHAAAEPVRIAADGPPTKYKPYTLVRVKASGVDEKSAIVWRVTPKANVSRATTPRGVLEFVAPPGLYTVECQVLTINKETGGIESEEQETVIEIESCCDKLPPIVPPTPLPPTPPKPKAADPMAALGRIQFGNAGCTATVIGPRRSDGRWDMLTAAHCVTSVAIGSKGTCQLRDGRKFAVVMVSRSKLSNEGGPDCAWLTIDDATLADLPFAEIAAANPAPGVKMWHAGFGVDVPGNRENGTVTAGEDANGQIEMSISVSSGDSGGGMFRTDTGELIACVCCTTAKGQVARVWGCSAEVARNLRPKVATDDTSDWFTPIDIPQRGAIKDGTAAPWWTPVEMPERTVRAPIGVWIKEPVKGR